MFKVIVLLSRRDDLTREGFKHWWIEEHAPLARHLPGVRRIVGNLATTDDSGYDGITELWFDTQEAFEAAYASEIGQKVAADSVAHVAGRVRVPVEEIEISVG